MFSARLLHILTNLIHQGLTRDLWSAAADSSLLASDSRGFTITLPSRHLPTKPSYAVPTMSTNWEQEKASPFHHTLIQYIYTLLKIILIAHSKVGYTSAKHSFSSSFSMWHTGRPLYLWLETYHIAWFPLSLCTGDYYLGPLLSSTNTTLLNGKSTSPMSMWANTKHRWSKLRSQ